MKISLNSASIFFFKFNSYLNLPYISPNCRPAIQLHWKKWLCFFINQTLNEYTCFFRIHMLAEMGAGFTSEEENQFQKTLILPCVILAVCTQTHITYWTIAISKCKLNELRYLPLWKECVIFSIWNGVFCLSFMNYTSRHSNIYIHSLTSLSDTCIVWTDTSPCWPGCLWAPVQARRSRLKTLLKKSNRGSRSCRTGQLQSQGGNLAILIKNAQAESLERWQATSTIPLTLSA